MAVETFVVVYDRQPYGSTVDGGGQEKTKAQAEALHGKLKEKVKVVGPIEHARVIEIEAETEAEAAIAARLLVGAKEGEGELFVAKKTNVKKNSAR